MLFVAPAAGSSWQLISLLACLALARRFFVSLGITLALPLTGSVIPMVALPGYFAPSTVVPPRLLHFFMNFIICILLG
jgi:hypothetical protein